MKSMLSTAPGGPDTLVWTEQPDLSPAKGELLIDIRAAAVNFPDTLIIRDLYQMKPPRPFAPGGEISGVVAALGDGVQGFEIGDRVLALTGHGGFATQVCVAAPQAVKFPEDMPFEDAAAFVFTYGTSYHALKDRGDLKPGETLLVLGAAGGVGSVATAILGHLGYEVAAVTGRPETADYLKSLGATQIVAREDINETVKRPLESETWAGCVDAVGGDMLARVLGQMKYGASVAAVGLAGGAGLPATVIPFLLRGVNLLGIDSVMQPYDNRLRAWQRLAADLPMEKLEAMVTPAVLSDLPQLGADILKGQVKGRVVVDVNA